MLFCWYYSLTLRTSCNCLEHCSECVLAMPFFRFCTVLGLTEKPRTGPEDNPCEDSPVSDEYKPLSFWSWHVFCDLYKSIHLIYFTAVFSLLHKFYYFIQVHYIKLWFYNAKICLNACTLYFTSFLQFPK